MGVWNEAEARKRVEDAMRRKRESQAAAKQEELRRIAFGNGTSSTTSGMAGFDTTQVRFEPGVTLFDATAALEQANKIKQEGPGPPQSHHHHLQENVVDGFEALDLGGDDPTRMNIHDPIALLKVLSEVRSIRGYARAEYGRIYGALAPLYFDIVRAVSHKEPYVFQIYREPEQQSKMLANLRIFGKSDLAQGAWQREDRLQVMTGLFENAALREFEHGLEAGDREGRMKRYANVLFLLNGGQSAADVFVQKHPIVQDKEKLGSPSECFRDAKPGELNLASSHEFFERLRLLVNEQTEIIDQVFPPSVNVLLPLLDRVADEVISEYVTPLLDEAHQLSIEWYLIAVAGVFNQCMRFGKAVRPTAEASENFQKDLLELLGSIFEPHIDLYMQEELEYFKKKCESEVGAWERKIADEEIATESFYMANVNRQADKKDFMTSFKKVVMMPVNVVTNLPLTGSTKSQPLPPPQPLAYPPPYAGGSSSASHLSVASPPISRPNSAINGIDSPFNDPSRTSSPAPLPTTELAAKTAIMDSKLKGISSLFSIEVALSLVHTAKSSLERAASFVTLGGQTGEEAKEQCSAIFVHLLKILGTRHIQSGFDRAISHLSTYDSKAAAIAAASSPTSPTTAPATTVTPLVMFLELVSVGDLIQQMIDVFFEQELVAVHLADRNDFLDPAVKEKKRFEQILDERVAAGLNKGIDVLISEVDYILATTQKPTDFNPDGIVITEAPLGGSRMSSFQNSRSSISSQNTIPDLGPSATSQRVISLVASHTKILVGSTDKTTLDVFNAEIALRLFASLCKHLKRQRISTLGSLVLISDTTAYASFIGGFKNRDLNVYYQALRELSQVYLIEGRKENVKELAVIIADGERFKGVWGAEEVLEFVERRADWILVRRDVERALYGIGCVVC
jgi:recyclin-1